MQVPDGQVDTTTAVDAGLYLDQRGGVLDG